MSIEYIPEISFPNEYGDDKKTLSEKIKKDEDKAIKWFLDKINNIGIPVELAKRWGGNTSLKIIENDLKTYLSLLGIEIDDENIRKYDNKPLQFKLRYLANLIKNVPENKLQVLINQQNTKINESETETNEKHIDLIIIDDLVKIRERIKHLLPDALEGEFFINFEETDNVEDAKELIFQVISNCNENIGIILDNNLFEKSGEQWAKKNTGLELYNWIKEIFGKEFLKNVAIFSSSKKEEILRIFGKNVKIIGGKSERYVDSVHINEIKEWLIESYKK